MLRRQPKAFFALLLERLRAPERLAADLAAEGLELGLQPIDPLNHKDIARMSPKQHAGPYRMLVLGSQVFAQREPHLPLSPHAAANSPAGACDVLALGFSGGS